MRSGSFARFGTFNCVYMCLNLFFTSMSTFVNGVLYRRDKFHRKKCKHYFLGIKFVLCDLELYQLVSEKKLVKKNNGVICVLLGISPASEV